MIDGIVSGKLQLKPKMLKTRRGTDYLIAKMTVYGYAAGNLQAVEMNADVIAFDRKLCHDLMQYEQGSVLSICGVIRPVDEEELGGRETVLKITAMRIVDGYIYGQAKGKGRLFRLTV